jgi:hypothetical protein
MRSDPKTATIWIEADDAVRATAYHEAGVACRYRQPVSGFLLILPTIDLPKVPIGPTVAAPGE